MQLFIRFHRSDTCEEVLIPVDNAREGRLIMRSFSLLHRRLNIPFGQSLETQDGDGWRTLKDSHGRLLEEVYEVPTPDPGQSWLDLEVAELGRHHRW